MKKLILDALYLLACFDIFIGIELYKCLFFIEDQ